MARTHTDLSTTIAGIEIRNPVMLAAGTAGVLDEMADVLPLARIGAVVTKSITPEPRAGNETWRILPSKAGMLNAIGLANPGVEGFMAAYAPRIASVPCAVVGSIAGFSIEDYVAVARHFETLEAMRLVELNVSCPNVKHGVEFGADARLLGELVSAVRAELGSTGMLIKLSPISIGTPTTIVDIARAAIDAGADGLSLCNTMPAMAIDVETRRPRLANRTGGLSGPGVHPAVVKIVHDVYRSVARDAGVPIVGIGGVLGWDDAAEFMLAGASAVQIGTGSFASPGTAGRVVKGLEKWGRRQRVARIADLVGAVEA